MLNSKKSCMKYSGKDCIITINEDCPKGCMKLKKGHYQYQQKTDYFYQLQLHITHPKKSIPFSIIVYSISLHHHFSDSLIIAHYPANSKDNALLSN